MHHGRNAVVQTSGAPYILQKQSRQKKCQPFKKNIKINTELF